jgi:hypothetical protein
MMSFPQITVPTNVLDVSVADPDPTFCINAFPALDQGPDPAQKLGHITN